MDLVAARARDAARDRRDRARRLQRREVHLRGVTSSFFRRDGKFFVRTDGPDGKLADFEVKYTFGVEPLQQYLVELPGGRLQALAVAWDTRPEGSRRPALVPPVPGREARLPRRTALDRRAQNWNFMCADCHSSQVTQGLRRRPRTLSTRAGTRSRSAASRATARARRTSRGPQASPADPGKGLTVQLDERRGVSWSIDPATGNATRSRERTSEREIEVCAQCHARRAQIAEGYRAGQRLHGPLPAGAADAGAVSRRRPAARRGLHLGLVAAEPDASQGRDLQRLPRSALAEAARRRQCSVRPVPRAGQIRRAGAPPSSGRLCGRAVCRLPHAADDVHGRRRPARPQHARAAPGPVGRRSACPTPAISCHTRSRCASGRRPRCAAGSGVTRTASRRFATTFHAAEAGQAGAAASLAAIANDVAQAAHRARIGARTPGSSPATRMRGIAQRAARDVQPLLRLASVRLAESLPPPEQARVLASATHGSAARGPHRSRARDGRFEGLAHRRAARRMAERGRRVRGHAGYTADRPEARVALGSFQSRLRHTTRRRPPSRRRWRSMQRYVPAYLNAADASARRRAATPRRADCCSKGLAHAPKDAALHYALGLTLVRLGQRRTTVLRELERAAQLAPAEPRYTYVYAVALNSTGRPRRRFKVLERATAALAGQPRSAAGAGDDAARCRTGGRGPADGRAACDRHFRTIAKSTHWCSSCVDHAG